MFENNSPLGVEITSSTQIFPESPHKQQTITPLSIIDNTVSFFSRTGAVWFYDPPSKSNQTLSVSQLQDSLSKTLDSYRHFCGRLSYVSAQHDKGHTQRYRRIQVTYGAPTDIGVKFVVAKSPKILAESIPSVSMRKESQKAWDMSQIPINELLPSGQMSLARGAPADAPNLVVQITTFACGSFAVGIGFTHALSDAQGMCTFANDWASVSRALHAKVSLPNFSPVFDPRLLDAAAAGDIDAEKADEAIINQVSKLPLHRFDWYKEVPGQPWPAPIPDDLDPNAKFTPSDPIPWHEWDTKAAEAGRVLHYTPAEIQHIYAQAITTTSSKISKHDALLAHLWSRINVARQHKPGTLTYLDLTIGLRPRLSLPQNFIGSPITLVAVPSKDSSSDTGFLAGEIRRHLAMFDARAIGAYLHEAAFEISPQRLWRCFLGKKHILQTSWIQSGFQDVDFVGVGGPELRYVKPEMGGDGLLLIMEALGEEKGHWTTNGADVNLFLEEKSMERLLEDPKLWG